MEDVRDVLEPLHVRRGVQLNDPSMERLRSEPPQVPRKDEEGDALGDLRASVSPTKARSVDG